MKKEWICIKLGQFAPFFYGKSLPGNCRDNSGKVPVYGSSGIVGFHTEALTDGPTIIIGRKGTVGALYYSPVPCWPIDTTFYISGGDRELIRYKYYLLKSLKLDQMNADSAVPGLNRDAAHSLVIYIPPSEEEQCAIAHILGTLDDKIELNRRMNETLEQMARAIFKSWFVDFDPVRAKMSGRWKKGESLPVLPAYLWDLFPDRLVPSELGEIPEGWEIKKLSTLCTVQYGYTANAVQKPIGPKLLRVTDINKQNWIDWNSVPYCSISDLEKEKYSLKIGDIVVARMADPGKSAIIEEELHAVFASYLVRLKTDSLSMAYYLYGFLKSDLYKRYITETSTGSVQPSMNAKVIVAADLIVPPVPIREAYFDFILPIRHRINKNLKESHTLFSIRDTALPKLLGGRMPLNIDQEILWRQNHE